MFGDDDEGYDDPEVGMSFPENWKPQQLCQMCFKPMSTSKYSSFCESCEEDLF